MRAEVKGLWITALRSGKYEQSMGKLRELDEEGNVLGFCCLGVLTDICPLVDWDELDPAMAFLPEEVRVWAELDGLSPDIQWKDSSGTDLLDEAVDLNDGGDYSFEDIAWCLEHGDAA